MSSSQFELCVENPTLTSDMTQNNVYKWVQLQPSPHELGFEVELGPSLNYKWYERIF